VLETPHVIVAAAIAVKIGRPELALPLALASHFILDMVPHWNPHINQEVEKLGKVSKKSTIIVVIDSTIALAIGSAIAFHALPNYSLTLTILASCLLGVLPDLAEAPYFFLDIKSKAVRRWIHSHRNLQSDAPAFWGILTQVTIVAATLWWLK
jgi:hypothetical protein